MKLLKEIKEEEIFYTEDNEIIGKIVTQTYRIQFLGEAEYVNFVKERTPKCFMHILKYENLGTFNNPDCRWVGTFVMKQKITMDSVEIITKKQETNNIIV